MSAPGYNQQQQLQDSTINNGQDLQAAHQNGQYQQPVHETNGHQTNGHQNGHQASAVGQQPQQQNPMQPVKQEKVNGAASHSDEWESSLFNCTPMKSCLLSCCCPCLLVGKTSERMRDPTMQTENVTGNTDTVVTGLLHCFGGCGWVWVGKKRGEIRERFGIKGSAAGDFFTACCCMCCAAIQQDNEVIKRTQHQVNTSGYQANNGMNMP